MVNGSKEEEEDAGGGSMDMQMLAISLVYAIVDTSRTLLNSYALRSSSDRSPFQLFLIFDLLPKSFEGSAVNPNSVSFLSFLVGLAFASLMTWRAHGLGCKGEAKQLGETSLRDLS